MKDVRELTAGELSTVVGGMRNNPPPPAPTPLDLILKWIKTHL